MSTNSSYQEKELLNQVAQGDEAAFASLFKMAYSAVYRAALMVTASPFLAEEVVQDVFLKIWLRRRELHAIDNFESYLFIVARNQAYKAVKKQARWELLQQEGKGTEADEMLEAELMAKLDAQKLMHVYEAAVNQLPPQQQQVYRLSKRQHLRREQVAAQMEIRPDTVKKYLAAAILNIRGYCMHHAPELLPGILFLCRSYFF